MNDKYESPLPILSVDTDILSIETTDVQKGKISIKNSGGGVLKGNILSRCKGLTFEPSEFEGNAEISYTFNSAVAGLGIGEEIESHFYITSNGGEEEIVVYAKLTKMSISTAEGHVIANIRDFYEYSLSHPTQARRLFIDSEFYMLLLASGYEFMEVYESLHKDANRERAMDNFFILSGLKGKTELSIYDESETPGRIEYSRSPDRQDVINGSFLVKKSDKGYVEAALNVEAEWLTLSSGKLTAADFDEENIATVGFKIEPKKITSTLVREQINVGESEIEIIYRRLPPLVLRLNRDTYRYADKGSIEIINNTGANMQVSVFCPENYIRFSARSFPIGARGEIPFEIKLSAFMNAQMLFRKLPYMKTVIELIAKTPGKEYKKTLPIVVGEW
ncbi:MAG: DUF5717 family protein [Defluviitaleaceae bacterium]|nr:DUF5717 family protein [Defluviitaleaceae bacterium]